MGATSLSFNRKTANQGFSLQVGSISPALPHWADFLCTISCFFSSTHEDSSEVLPANLMSLCQTDSLTWVQRSISSRPVLDAFFVVPWVLCVCIILVSMVSEERLIAVTHRWISQLFMQRLAVFSRDVPHNEKDIIQRITKKIGINSFHSRWDQSHCMVENLPAYKWVSPCTVFKQSAVQIIGIVRLFTLFGVHFVCCIVRSEV